MITLDIEDTAIKVMAVRGSQVETAVTLPLEPGLVQDGVVVNPAIVGRLMGELIAAHGISEKRAVVGISGIHSIYRVVNVPKLPKNLIDEAAQREAERVMPVPLNELYLSWQTISMSDIETAICLVGMPRSTVDAMLDTLRQAGLQPEAMDVKPLALARVTDERDAIIINIQQSGFDIVIMTEGIPELLRSLPFPGGTESADEKIDEVKEELERTVAFYNSSHKGAEITSNMAAFVSGELGDMLAATLEYRARPLPRLLSYSNNLNINEYAANIGLALRQARAAASPARVSLNVTPEAYMPKPFPMMQLVSWAFILLAVAVLLMFGILTLQKYTNNLNLQTQVSKIQAQVQARQGSQATIELLQKKINEAEKAGVAFKEPLDKAKAQRAKANGYLSKATSMLPGTVQFTGLKYAPGEMTVQGIAPHETIVVNYVRDLRNSGQFSEVLISEMSEIAYNRWQFKLTLK